MEYLVKTGQDINSYTEKLAPGDIVRIESGEYGGRLIVRVPAVVYEAIERHKVNFLGQIYFDDNVTKVVIDGFKNQIVEPYGNIDMYQIGMANNIIRNCIIIGDGEHGGIGFTGLNNIFENNEVYNTGHGFHHGGRDIPDGTIYRKNIIHDCLGHGIGAVGGKNEKVIGNIVYNCRRADGYGGTGIFYGTASPENIYIGSNLVWGCTNHQIFTKGIGTIIVSNTAVATDRSTSYTYYIESNSPEIRNNIGVRFGSGNRVILVPRSATTDYNCWYNPDEPKCISRYYDKMTLETYKTYGQGLNSISQDPKFVDIANNDYRLQADSPCKNMGYPYEIQPTPEPGPEPEPTPEPEYVKKSVLIEALQGMIDKIKGV